MDTGTVLLFAGGIVLLVAGAEFMVRGASRLASAMGISTLVVGLTVVAFGTSAPELAVTTAATLRDDPDLALGNVVGSNILNVLLILGLSAVVAPLVVHRRVIRLEVPFMVAISTLVVMLALDRSISRVDGVLLLALGLLYTGGLVIAARRTNHSADGAPPAEGVRRLGHLSNLAFVVGGIALLVVGSRWIVDGARAMASAFGIPDLVIGLTIVSAGTSLPELATTVMATVRGERGMAVGNIIGSNLFNLLIILGTAAALSPGGIGVPTTALTFDLPVMLAVAVSCLPIFFTGHRIDRLEGMVFLGFYLAYTAHLALDATRHHALDQLQEGLLLFVLPLTLLALALSAVRELR